MIHPAYPELNVTITSGAGADTISDTIDVTLLDGTIATVKPELPDTPSLQVVVTTLGIKESGKEDFTVIALPPGSRWGGLFTKNKCASSTVTRNKALREHGEVRLIAVNSGNANVFTPNGEADCRETAQLLSTEFEVPADEILVFSTGVIGHPLPMEKFRKGIPGLAKGVRVGNLGGASRAILTTDVGPKVASVMHNGVLLCGIAKGAGMIEPNLATMLVYLFTNVTLTKDAIQEFLSKSVTHSFNSMSVDSDTSTNDSVILSSTNELPAHVISGDDFQRLLSALCIKLTRDIVSQGEGVTKLIEVCIESAWPESAARNAAKAIINSPLIKCAVHGADPNWGRIVMALGKSTMDTEYEVDPKTLHIRLQGVSVYRFGEALSVDWAALSKSMKNERIVEVSVILGTTKDPVVRAWGCDLSNEYVAINADYTT